MLLLQDQQTPLHWSSMNGRVVIVNMLLSHGADIHVTDKVIKYYDCSYYITNDCNTTPFRCFKMRSYISDLCINNSDLLNSINTI